MTKESSTKKKLALSAGLLTTGLVAGAMFSPLGLAGAQESDTDNDTGADTGSDVSGDDDGRGFRHGKRGLGAEVLGIDADTLRAGFEAGKTLVEIAEENGITEAELIASLEAAAEERLAAAVEDGRLTQERADEIAADMADKITERINSVPAERGEGHGGRRGHARGHGFEALEELGLTQDEIRAGFEAGNTLAETAAENGIAEDDLVSALVAAAQERAAEAVESGRVTQDQVDEHLADVEERIAERITAEPGDRAEHAGRKGGHRGQGHFGSTDNGDVDGDTEGASLSF